ncbi:MAG: IclR family transcriptional regulator [Methylobacteriaceae bacterium]|jgi:DNA-binding IclR family transcriptional regulator|nr:IclR family transcriptional regulator [Methylobacteriaceae bacterium]
MNNTISRITEILQLVARSNRPLTMADVRKQLGLAKSSASNLINSLVELGVLELNEAEGNTIEAGLAFFELSAKFINKNSPLSLARRSVSNLADISGCLAFFMMYNGTNLVFVERAQPPGSTHIGFFPGESVPLHASAAGKAFCAAHKTEDIRRLLGNEPFERFTPHTIIDYPHLLADIEQTRARKFAMDQEEMSLQVASIAAPVKRIDGTVAGIISLIHTPLYLSRRRMDELGPSIHAAALRISRMAGYTGDDIF